MPSSESFAAYIPGHDERMEYMNANNKRPAPVQNGFRPVKHKPYLDESGYTAPSPSMFVSDDEEDEAMIDDGMLFGESDGGGEDFIARGYTRDSSAQVSSATNSIDVRRSNGNLHRSQARSQPQTHVRPSKKNSGDRTTAVSQARQLALSSQNKPDSTPEKPVEVKDEPESHDVPPWLSSIPTADRVKIYVGKRNKVFYATREDLAKSKVLSSYIINDPQQEAYIMRPQLLELLTGDFDALLEFMHSGELTPKLIEKGGEKVLDNVKGDGAYYKELVRYGRIYVMAQMFQVQELEGMIYKSISEVDKKHFPIKAFVELAGAVFSDKRVTLNSTSSSIVGKLVHNSDDGNGVTASNELESRSKPKDKLEEWIIGHIADNLQEITKKLHVEFWVVERKTTKSMFLARVLEEAADRYRATGGKLPATVIELLD